MAVEAIAAVLEVVAGGDAVAERGQFQERHVEAAAVEGDELGLVARQAEPELLDDLLRPEVRRIEARECLQREVGADAKDAHRHRDLERDREEVRVPQSGLFPRVLLGALERLLGRQILLRVLHRGHEIAIGDGLGVDDQEGGAGGFRCSHQRVLGGRIQHELCGTTRARVNVSSGEPLEIPARGRGCEACADRAENRNL